MDDNSYPSMPPQANPPHTPQDVNSSVHELDEESAAFLCPFDDEPTQGLSLDRCARDRVGADIEHVFEEDDQLFLQQQCDEYQNQDAEGEEWVDSVLNQSKAPIATDITDQPGDTTRIDDSLQASRLSYSSSTKETESTKPHHTSERQSWRFSYYKRQPQDHSRDSRTDRKDIKRQRTYAVDASSGYQAMEQSSKIRRKTYVKPYIQFCNEARVRVRRANPRGTNKEIMQIIAGEWAALSPQDKAKYKVPKHDFCFHMETPTTYTNTHLIALKE